MKLPTSTLIYPPYVAFKLFILLLMYHSYMFLNKNWILSLLLRHSTESEQYHQFLSVLMAYMSYWSIWRFSMKLLLLSIKSVDRHCKLIESPSKTTFSGNFCEWCNHRKFNALGRLWCWGVILFWWSILASVANFSNIFRIHCVFTTSWTTCPFLVIMTRVETRIKMKNCHSVHACDKQSQYESQ